MNKREARLRALKLSLYCLRDAFDNNGIFDLVDEETTDDEALQIADEAKSLRDALWKRIYNLEKSQCAPKIYDAGEVGGVRLTVVDGAVYATPKKSGVK